MPDQSVILLAEDREDDILLIKKAFEQADINNPVQIVRDGEEALHYLAGEGRYSNRAEFPLPALILVDLKMPKVDGFEVVRWIRCQLGFSNLPVVVLTSSDAIRDVNRAYELGANSFLVKPSDFDNFLETAKILKKYWLNINKAPTANRFRERVLRRDSTEGTVLPDSAGQS